MPAQNTPAQLNCAQPLFGDRLPLETPPPPHDIANGYRVNVAVIDTGAATPGATGDRSSCVLHGTAVTSVLREVAPGATVHSIRHSPREDRAEGTVAELIAAINTAREENPQIINISMVACEDTRELRDAVTAAQRDGALIVASVGNHGQCDEGVAPFPASIDGVIAVSAVSSTSPPANPSTGTLANGAPAEHSPGVQYQNGTHNLNAGRTVADYSAPGPWAQLYAPGGPVSATLDTDAGPRTIVGGPQPFIGTSFATPIISGTAALVWQAAPHLTAAEVRDILLQTATLGGAVPGSAEPLRVVNAQAAVEKALELREEHARKHPGQAGHGQAGQAHGDRAQNGHPVAPSSDALDTPGTADTSPTTVNVVNAAPVQTTAPDYSVPIALALLVSTVLIVALVARAFASESKPESGRTETTRHEAG